MGLVSKDEEGRFSIGPLTEEQYVVIIDSLELASAWTDREMDLRVASALRKLLIKPVPSDAPAIVRLPAPDSDEIECP